MRPILAGLLDKVEKETQLERLWQQTSTAYNYLYQVYQYRDYLTPREANFANQISQTLMVLQSQKMKVDHDLANEMMKHLVKMIVNVAQSHQVFTRSLKLFNDADTCGYPHSRRV